MGRTCPYCGLVNPKGAFRCDCGFKLILDPPVPREAEMIAHGAGCPSCGSLLSSSVRSKKWVAFANDRICSDCNQRYAPATPLWGPIGLVLAGLVLMVLFGRGFLLTILSGNPLALAFFFLHFLPTMIGFLALAVGVRALFTPRA